MTFLLEEMDSRFSKLLILEKSASVESYEYLSLPVEHQITESYDF